MCGQYDILTDNNYSSKQRRTTYRLLTSTYTSSSLPQHIQLNTFTVKSAIEEANMSSYDPEVKEFTSRDPISGRLTTTQRIAHQGEINRARVLPQNPDLIATITSTGTVYVFDKTKHSSQENEFKCEIECKGHSDEGFALAWNGNKEGELVTGAMDGMIKLWDITKFNKGEKLDSEKQWDNSQGVNDLDWCSFHDSMFVSGSEDNLVKVWDTRLDSKVQSKKSTMAHSAGVNAVSWNKGNMFCVASGDGTGKVNVWDIRQFDSPVYTIDAHQGGISAVEFNPNMHNIVSTSGFDDNSVKLWDFSRQDPLIFHHVGHLLGVNDIAWNPHEPWMISSVSNDNTVHIWQPSQEALS